MDVKNDLLIQKAKKKRFNVIQGKTQIDSLIDRLPKENECFKFLSDGGFSSVSFIVFVADKAKINNLHVSSFRVGKKDIQVMHLLKKKVCLAMQNLRCVRLRKMKTAVLSV